ncbi:riboflavin biosynthesis protein RibF [Limosilactobacillus antri]|uniref:riboflavin biosynthesis protein RibF n=1 Tax=Limosilactobacillus antri TaxID=227943 RepID=UPI001F5A2041|nr:riboflavin biosynthesis protein RibF [Limosilactobacillus antri]
MRVIKIHHPLDKSLVPAGPVVLAMGFFDGVHRGHQAVIGTAKRIAKQRGLPLAVLTYDHAPGIVYHQYPDGFDYLSTTKRKLELLEELGVDLVYLVSFTSAYASLTPADFVADYLRAFHSQVVVAGFDHTYGTKDVATMERLPKYAAGQFEVVTVPKFTLADQPDVKVGSRQIRQLIATGQVGAANDALGYRYQTSGLVVHGLARGRTLGFPTANIEAPENELLPGIGVYAVTVQVGGHWYGGMASVGHNITFGKAAKLTVEIYLFDFRRMIYGEEVKVRWYQYIRGEEKFAGADELVAQMKHDEANARQILARAQQTNWPLQ